MITFKEYHGALSSVQVENTPEGWVLSHDWQTLWDFEDEAPTLTAGMTEELERWLTDLKTARPDSWLRMVDPNLLEHYLKNWEEVKGWDKIRADKIRRLESLLQRVEVSPHFSELEGVLVNLRAFQINVNNLLEDRSMQSVDYRKKPSKPSPLVLPIYAFLVDKLGPKINHSKYSRLMAKGLGYPQDKVYNAISNYKKKIKLNS